MLIILFLQVELGLLSINVSLDIDNISHDFILMLVESKAVII